MKTTIHWRTIFYKIIGLVIIVFSILKMAVNSGFFTFLLVVGVAFLVAETIVILRIDEHQIRFDRYHLNGTIKKTELIELKDIVKIEFEDGRTSWEDIFLNAIPSKNPDKLIIHRKSAEVKEYELHFYKREKRLIRETLDKKIKTLEPSYKNA